MKQVEGGGWWLRAIRVLAGAAVGIHEMLHGSGGGGGGVDPSGRGSVDLIPLDLNHA